MSSFVTAGGDIGNGELLAQNAQDTANDANKKNSANSQQIANINDPNYLTPFEKPQLEIQMDNFAAIYKTDKYIAAAEGIDFTAYDAAYQAYLAYMKPLTADITTYSPIVRATFNSLITAFQNAKTAFDAATKAQYTQAMDKAKTDIANNQSSYAAMKQDVATMKTNANSVATIASAAISSAGFANDTASTASQAAGDAKTIASQAANNVAIAKNDAANALTNAMSAINNAKSALSEAKSASEKYESLGMVKAWGNTSPQNQNMNNWIMSDPAKKAATITCINGVNTIEYTGVANYEVFNMPISAKIGKKVSVTFSYTQPSVISLGGTKNGIPVSFFETASLNSKAGTSPIYLGTDPQTDKVYTISTIATAETMYLAFNFGYLSDNHHWQFKVSVQQDMSTTTPTDDTPGYVGFANKQSDNPADYTWLRNPDKFEGDVQQQFTDINGQLESKVSKDTYNALAGTVSENSTLSKQNQNALVNKADSQTVNLLTKRVSTAENTLTQTATKTALKQTKTDVDNINKTVQTNTSNISAQAGKIDGLLSTTNKLGDQYTNLSGKFNLSSKTWETNFSKVQSSVDAVARGGRNLILNSADLSSFLTWTANGSKPTVSADGHEMTIVTKHGGLNINSVNLSKDLPNIGDTVTISVEAKGTATLQFNYNNGTGFVGAQNFTISNDYKRYSAQFVWKPVAGTNQQFVVYTADSTATTLVIKHPQIEISSVAHDWSPAPEDMATVTALTQVKQTAKGAKALATNNHGDIAKLQITAKGLQTSVSNAATKDQLTILSSQLTNQITDLKSSTNSQFTQTASDMDLLVKKGDVVNQFNIDAGGALLQTVGGNTKIVLSAPNIIFDTANPVQIPNANIAGILIGKTFEAGTITATTKIISSDIEAALIHSKDNSFSLNGATGDMIGASIHAADNSWGISNTGKIHGTNITASVMDISGDGKGPNFDAVNVTPDTTQGIYSRYKYSVNSGYDVSKFGRKLYKNGYLVINGDTFLNRTIGDWSADGGGKYVYDTMYEAHTIKMRAYNYTGSNVQTDDPSSTEGSISSRLDIQPSAITMGRDWSVGNPNILIDGDGLLKVGSIAINGHHSMGTTDGSDMYFMHMNKDATDVSGTSIPIHAARYYTANMGISGGHVINSYDGHDVYLEDKWGSGGNMVSLHVKKLYNSSLLSLKTDITTIDPNDALETIANTDFRSYRFKTDDPSEPKSVSPILDDENQIPIYNTPNIFKSADGKSRNDGNILGYTALSVQALYAKIKDLTARLQKLEGAN